MNRKITNKIILIISTFLILSSLLFAGNPPSPKEQMEIFKTLMVLSLIYVIIPIVFIIMSVIVILSRKLRTTIKLIIVVIIIGSYLFIYRTYASNRDINSLMDAAENGYLGEVKDLVGKKRVYINARGEFDETALIKAAENGNLGIVKYLVENGADINAGATFGETALIRAAKNGNLGVVKYLVENGADFGYRDSLVNAAISGGNLEIYKYLTKNGADVRDYDLENALQYGKSEIVKYLVEEKGIDIKAKDEDGINALSQASERGDLEIVKYLLENGADINAKDGDGETALMKASYSTRGLYEEGDSPGEKAMKDLYLQYMFIDKLEIVKYLIEKGANVNIKNNEGKTALDLAETEEIREVLIKAGATTDINAKNEDGIRALIWAAYDGNFEEVKRLVKQGANVNAKNEDGYTALMYVSSNGHLEIVKFLIEKGADINTKDKNGITALMNASNNGHLEIVKYLLEKGADINAKDENGITALMNASYNGNLEIVKYLVEKGADINAKTENG